MYKNIELVGSENKPLRSTSSKSLLGTINTEPINTKKIKLSHLSKTCNEDSILDNIDTGFGSEYELVKECKKPVYKTHLCKESYLSEFKSETEKQLARTNLGVVGKNEVNVIIQQSVSDFIVKTNLITISDLEEIIKDYTTSEFRSQVNYEIPNQLFKQ